MKSTNNFISPRFIGKRFEDHSIPMDILKDFAVFEDMIFEIARWIYKEENIDKKRAPKKFFEGVSIKLQSIEHGSAVANFVVHYENQGLFNTGVESYVEKAREKFVETIKNSAKKISVIPPNLLLYFDKIGRGLRDSEAIEFRMENNETAVLNREVRHQLILSSGVTTDYSEETELYGTIPEADQEQNKFTILLVDGKRINCPLEQIHQGAVMEAFIGYKQKQNVKIKGVVVMSYSGKINRVESIDRIELLDPLDLGARLNEIGNLKAGWLNGEGVGYDTAELKWFEDCFRNYYPGDITPPKVFPTSDGSLRMEWSASEVYIISELNLKLKIANIQIIHPEFEEVTENSFGLSNEGDWIKFTDYIIRGLQENHA